MARSPALQSAWAPKLVAIVALPLVLYALYAIGQKAVESHYLSEGAQGVRTEIRELREENLLLQREIELARGEAAVERGAREHLGLVKPGDRAVAIVAPTSVPGEPAPITPGGADAAGAPGPPVPTWRQWWRFFFETPSGE